MNKDGYFLYHVPPIDFFDLSIPIKQLAKKEMEDYFSEDSEIPENFEYMTVSGIAKYGPRKPLSVVDKWERAKHLIATELSWEGDYSLEPCAFVVPIEDGFELGFVIKQENNGCTFIASPVELPHLKSLADSI